MPRVASRASWPTVLPKSRYGSPLRYKSNIGLLELTCLSDKASEFHARIIDVGERLPWFRFDQKSQPYRRREYPMFRLRLRARCLGRERPKHRSVSAVTPDAQLDRAQFVADVAQLPQRFDLRIGFGHAVERLAT